MNTAIDALHIMTAVLRVVFSPEIAYAYRNSAPDSALRKYAVDMIAFTKPDLSVWLDMVDRENIPIPQEFLCDLLRVRGKPGGFKTFTKEQ